MQGKERNNHHIDAEFEHFAWSEMSALLDKEMPVAPAPVQKGNNRRYGLFALLLLVGFISGVGTTLLLDKNDAGDQKEKLEQVKTPQKIADSENKAVAVLSNAETDQLITQQKTTQKVEQQIQNTFQNNSKTSANVGNLYTNSSSVIVKSSSSAKEIPAASQVVKKLTPVAKQTQQANLADLQSTQDISDRWDTPTAVIPTNALVAVDLPDHTTSLDYFPGYKAPKWSFGVFLSNHTRDWSGAHGWSAGLNTSYRMDGAFSIRTGLSYSQLTGFRSTSFGVNEPLTHTYFEPLEQTDLDYSSVSSLEGNQDLPFQSLHYLDLPVALHYKMSRKVGIVMGVKMSYLLDTQMDGYIADGLDDEQTDLLSEALYGSMRKVDVATVLGFSINPTKNIGLEFKYNHGLIDYTKDQLWHIRQLNTNKTFELGLHYTLR